MKIVRIAIAVVKGRSSRWPAIVDKHKEYQPDCQACIPGKKQRVYVHHILPVAYFPESEEDEDNLITLCKRHHLVFGHLENYKRWNDDVVEDCRRWRAKLAGKRPNV